MAVRDGGAEDLILPIRVGITHVNLAGLIAPEVLNQLAVGCGIEYIIFFLNHRDGHVAVVVYAGLLSTLTLFGGDDDNTV